MTTVLLAGLLAHSFMSTGQVSATKPDGFLAVPKSGKGTGVLVLHPWWGLNADVKAFCKRLAANGYTAFAPDLFQGKTATTRKDAQALVDAFEPKHLELKAQIGQAARFLTEKTGRSSIAVVGFSFGAYYALYHSNAEPENVRAVVVFYGTGQEDFSKSRAFYLGHFAEKDEFEPKANVDALAHKLKLAGRPAKVYTYPGTGHWFFEPSVKGAYDKKASTLAWKRTLEFLRKCFV